MGVDSINLYHFKNVFSFIDNLTKESEYEIFYNYYTNEFNVFHFLDEYAIPGEELNNDLQGIYKYGYDVKDALSNLNKKLELLLKCRKYIIDDITSFHSFVKNKNTQDNDFLKLFKDFHKVNKFDILKHVEIDEEKLLLFNNELFVLNTPWIRLFGILVSKNQLFITGGTIKMTNSTQGTKQGNLEVQKLNAKYIELLSKLNLK